MPWVQLLSAWRGTAILAAAFLANELLFVVSRGNSGCMYIAARVLLIPGSALVLSALTVVSAWRSATWRERGVRLASLPVFVGIALWQYFYPELLFPY